MMAITIWQPWASLIAAGAKPFEFRSWPAPRRLWGQRIAIHAGARPIRRAEIAELLAKLEADRSAETGLLMPAALTLLERVWQAPKSLPLSSVVCTAILGQPIRDAQLSRVLGLRVPINDSDRDEHSNWGWPLSDIQPVEPFAPARGAQGWWTWTPESGV
jgi:hypothetical protein